MRRLVVLAVLTAAPVFAQTEDWPGDGLRPIPHGPEAFAGPPEVARALSAPDPELERLAESLAAHATAQYEAARRLVEAPPASCADGASYSRYLRALRTLGRARRCLRLTDRCRSERPEGTPGLEQVLFEGARCASAEYEFDRSHELYDAATRPAYAASPEIDGIVYFFARFAQFTQFPDETRAILRRNPRWSETELTLAYGSLELLALGHTTAADPVEVSALVQRWIEQGRGALHRTAITSWARHLAGNLDRNREAARFLGSRAQELDEPDVWVSTAYYALYSQQTPSFLLARLVYDGTLPYLDRQGYMPTEQNTLDYTAIASSACPGRVLEGQPLQEHVAIRGRWSSGERSLGETLERAEALARAEPDKADLLSFLASLYELAGRDKDAADRYWRAHLACPYYDRSHWGLVSIERRRRNRSYSDYARHLERVGRELAGIAFPKALEEYVLDFDLLPPEGRKRLQYSLRLFAPYLSALYADGARLYVKQAFELLSEAPGLAGLRDRRIQGPGFEEDNRLWDDVRGVASGSFVTVDYGEMMEVPFGAYALVSHEVGHQFHHALPAAQTACLRRLYEGARARELFPDPYAGTNEFEYFAQGVVYFLTPTDAPPRFGLTVQWLVDNDPGLYRFLEQVREGREMGAITCPAS